MGLTAASHPSVTRAAAARSCYGREMKVAHPRGPAAHPDDASRKPIRSTNLLERTFVEVRRRTKVIGRFPGETSALCLIWAVLELSSRGCLIWAVLELSSRGWGGVVMTPKSVAEIERLRRGLAAAGDAQAQPTTEEVIAA
jgi:hypothetical protein